MKWGTTIDQVGGISATATTIPVAYTAVYGTTGKFKIGAEEITYGGLTATSFTGCTRGTNGTTAAAHANGAQVTYFVDPPDVIKRLFAHEAGHVVNLQDHAIASHNIMSNPCYAGSTSGSGYWVDFTGDASAITGDFDVKQ